MSKFTCDLCNTSLAMKEKLQTHLNIHIKTELQKQFEASFTNVSNLEIHTRVYMRLGSFKINSRIHKCQVC